jgi:hypothetical protein
MSNQSTTEALCDLRAQVLRAALEYTQACKLMPSEDAGLRATRALKNLEAVVALIPDSRPQQPRADLTRAVVSCPHEITADEVVLRYDPKQPGKNAFNQLMTRIEAAAQQPSGWQDIAPEGWKLVPVEPTDDMLKVMSGEWHSTRWRKARMKYAEMLAAAPAHPAEQQESTLPWHIPVQHWDNAEKAALRNSAAPAEQQEGGDARDAARYRWLREKAQYFTSGRAPMAVLCDESDLFQKGEAGSDSGFISGQRLDDAIDAAMTGGNGNAQ